MPLALLAFTAILFAGASLSRGLLGAVAVVLAVLLAAIGLRLDGRVLVAIFVMRPRRFMQLALRSAGLARLGCYALRRRLAGCIRAFSALLLKQAFARHGRSHDAIIVLGVLKVVLILDAVAARLGVTRVLRVLLINLSSRSPDLDVRTIAFERTVTVIMAVSVATATTAAGFTPAPPLTLHETIPDLQSVYRPNWTEFWSVTYRPVRTLGKVTGA